MGTIFIFLSGAYYRSAMQANVKNKIGLAMSGSGARSIFYLGFMEVLKERGIPIYAVAAQSGASIVATAYATDTLPELRAELLGLNWQKAKKYFSWSKNGLGLLSLQPAEERLRNIYTKGLEFSQLPIKLCFPATELQSGELVTMASGDIAKAIVTTCSVPGLFDPILWGNKYLMDGGILSTIPSRFVKDFGVDKVISVSIRATNHVFTPRQLYWKAKYNTLASLIKKVRPTKLMALAGGLKYLSNNFEDREQQEEAMSYSKLLSKTMDLALNASKQPSLEREKGLCDLVITEGEGNFGDSFSIKKGQALYELGRTTAEKHIDQILKLAYG